MTNNFDDDFELPDDISKLLGDDDLAKAKKLAEKDMKEDDSTGEKKAKGPRRDVKLSSRNDRDQINMGRISPEDADLD